MIDDLVNINFSQTAWCLISLAFAVAALSMPFVIAYLVKRVGDDALIGNVRIFFAMMVTKQQKKSGFHSEKRSFF